MGCVPAGEERLQPAFQVLLTGDDEAQPLLERVPPGLEGVGHVGQLSRGQLAFAQARQQALRATAQLLDAKRTARRGGGVDAASWESGPGGAYSAITTCALVPPAPKLETPATRGASATAPSRSTSGRLHGTTSWGTVNGVEAKSIPGLSAPEWSEGATSPCRICIRTLVTL